MKKLFYLSLAVLISASAVLSCKKSEENEDLHAVTKDYVLDGISATLNGALSLMEGEVLSTVYFLVSEKSKIPEDGTEIRIPGMVPAAAARSHFSTSMVNPGIGSDIHRITRMETREAVSDSRMS